MRHGGILIEANDSEGEPMKKHTTINQSLSADVSTCVNVAVDLAKKVFQVAGENALGQVIFEDRIKSREAFQTFLLKLPASVTVLVETGPGAQAWARLLQAQGNFGKMSKKGDAYLRSLAVQGAHAVLRQVRPDSEQPDDQRLQRWVSRLRAQGSGGAFGQPQPAYPLAALAKRPDLSTSARQ